MSAQPAAAVQRNPDASARRRSTLSLLVSVVLLVVVSLLLVSGYLVRLVNDHNQRPVLPGLVPGGGSASGELTLSNGGWLPIEVTLQPKLPNGGTPASLPADLKVSVQRVTDGRSLYSGPMRPSMGPLLLLQPGEAAKLRIEVSSTDAQAVSAVPLGYTYNWNARPAVPWWWWTPLILVVGLIATAGYWRPGRNRAGR